MSQSCRQARWRGASGSSNCWSPGLYLPPVFKAVAAVVSAPDDHFAAGPHCRVNVAAGGRVGGAGGCPTVRCRIVAPAGVQNDVANVSIRPRRSFRCRSTPPCDSIAASGRVGGAGRCPTVRRRDCSARRCSNTPTTVSSAPDDHLAAGPHRRVTRLARRARWWCSWLSNCPCRDCSARRCSKSCSRCIRPRRSSRCRSTPPCDSLGQRARWWCWWPSNCPCWDCSARRCSK